MAEERMMTIRRIGYGIAAAAVILSLLPFFVAFFKERNFIRQEAAFIGRVHEKLSEQEAEILEIMYDTDYTAQEISTGQEALINNGYTRTGLDILKKRLRKPETGIMMILPVVLISILLFFLLYRLLRKVQAMDTAAEEEIRQGNIELKRIPELELKNRRITDFIENIAHQLKTPLSRVMTSVELLQEELPEEKQARTTECMDHLMDMRRLIDRILEIGRMDAGEVIFHADSFSLRDLIEETVRTHPLGVHTKLLFNPEQGKFNYSGSEGWLREAFSNLLDNTEKYAGSGKSGPDVYSCELTAEELPDAYRITLRDFGPGFSEEDLPNLFDRFYRTKDMKKGHVGLGLNLVRLIVEGHKGWVLAENHPEGGALITLLLPRLVLMN